MVLDNMAESDETYLLDSKRDAPLLLILHRPHKARHCPAPTGE